jgi:hypothetical protein
MKTESFSPKLARQCSASALIAALMVTAVLALLAGVTISKMSASYRANFHSGSWEEAFRAAEAGADLGMAALNLSATDPTTAWTGWTTPPPLAPPATPAPPTRTKSFSATSIPPLPVHSGEGNTKLYATVVAFPTVPPGTTQTWYTVRSKGTAEIPGSKVTTYEGALRNTAKAKDRLSMLRKISFRQDKDVTGGALKLPQTSRTVELVSQPTHARLFQRALTVASYMTLGGGAYTDSFDSSRKGHTPPLAGDHSQANGTYGIAPSAGFFGHNGHVGTNVSGNLSDLNGSPVWGNAMSNGGVIADTQGVTGTVVNNFQTELPAVNPPDWQAGTYSMTSPPMLSGTTTLTASASKTAPARFQVTKIDLGSHDALTLANPDRFLADGITTNPNPAPAYIEIWSTGIMKTNAQATMDVGLNVFVKFFVAGDFDIGGGGTNNETGRAENIILYGITPTDGSARNFKMSGSSDFTGVIYTPAFDFVATGGGNYQGSITSKTAKIGGNAGYHYDEALGVVESDAIGGYQMAMWVEDTR